MNETFQQPGEKNTFCHPNRQPQPYYYRALGKIVKMKIIYKNKNTKNIPGRWHDVILTPAPRAASEPLSHIMSFTLKPLLPGSVYEAIVQAKNRYGWNEVSKFTRREK